MWERSDCNNRGEAFINFLGTTNLEILNVGCKPTIRNSVREEVLNISLASGRVGTRIRSWRVLEEVSMSDRRHITFELTDVKQESSLWRNLKKTDWAGYDKDLVAIKVEHLLDKLRMGYEIKHCADSLRECIVRSYVNNCSQSSKAEGNGKI